MITAPTDNKWSAVKLGDHIDLLTGYPFKSARFTVNDHDMPLVRGANIMQGYLKWDGVKRWPSEEAKEYSKYLLEPGDVVLAMDRPWIEAGLKQACISERDVPCLLVQRVARLRGRNGLLTGFLRYLIASPSFTDYIRPIVTGVNVPHISGSQIQSFKFRLPPLPIQRRIASVLSAYDDLIENNARRIGILEEMAKTIYREWFVNFRFPGHQKVGMVDSPLGPIPEGWKIKKVSEVASVHRGRSYRSAEIVEEGGLPFLNLKCVDRDGGFRREGIRRYQGPYKETQTAKPGDIILAVTDMTQERRIVARAARVPSNGEDTFVFSMDLVKIAPNPLIAPEYLYGMLRFSTFADHVKQHANGANVLHLNPTHIEGYGFVMPEPELTVRYATICSDIYRQSDLLHDKNTNLRRTRDLLLPKLISGEVSVENANEKVPG